MLTPLLSIIHAPKPFLIDIGLGAIGSGLIVRLTDKVNLVFGVAKIVPKDQLNPYPKEVLASFDTKNSEGIQYTEAKYEKNVILNKIDEHIIYATDVETNQLYRLAWKNFSAYLCINKPEVDLGNEVIDPSQQDLKGMKFFFWGNGWRGLLSEQAQDCEPKTE